MDRCRIKYDESMGTASESYDDYDYLKNGESVYGSEIDTIGLTVTPTSVNSKDFSVLFDKPGFNFLLGADSISIEVFYYEKIELEVVEGLDDPTPYADGCIGKNGDLVLVGLTGLIVISTDGSESWTRCHTGTSNTLRSVAYNSADGYLAVGDNGTVLVSDDGISWILNNEISGSSFTSIERNGKTVVGQNVTFSKINDKWQLGREAG